jgi:hypothetical protein
MKIFQFQRFGGQIEQTVTSIRSSAVRTDPISVHSESCVCSSSAAGPDENPIFGPDGPFSGGWQCIFSPINS